MKKKSLSNLPIVLTRKPRHRTSGCNWELEFSLEKPFSEQPTEGLAILGTALKQLDQNRHCLEQKTWVKLRLEGLEDFFVPTDYQELFRNLCDGGTLSAKMFFKTL